ncbi:MAG: SRPBCC domain-containing protein [Bacillota bacterium]
MEIHVERVMAAVPERVMRALTDPGELSRWACERAEVGAERFLLTGPNVATGAMGGRLLERAPDRLRIEWLLGGQPSEVEIALEAVPQTGNPPADFTRVRIAHRAIPGGVLTARYQQESWECVWVLLLRHLTGWVERAEAVGPFDYARPFGATVRQSVTMDAPRARVWRALTDPTVRSRWLTVPLGRELEREEGRRLVCEFDLNQPPTTVTWLLEELEGSRTRVTVIEEGLTWEGIDDHIGWHDYLVALYQETQPPLIRQTIWIKAAPAKVWRYVASQEGLRRWFAGNIRFQPEVGAPVTFEEHGGELRGRVTVLEPERKLAFTWTEPGAPGWSTEPEPLLLTMDVTPENGGTRVTLTHSGFENLPEAIWLSQYGSYRRGWAYGTTLPGLKQLVEAEAGVSGLDEGRSYCEDRP